MQKPRTWRIILALGTLGAALGCSTTPLHREHPQPDPLIKGQITEDKVERALRMKVMRRLEFLNDNKEYYQAQMVRTRIRGENYYFRFYDWFPGDWHDVKIAVTEQHDDDPLVTTYEGTAEYPYVRYETLYAGSAARIKTTENFVRDEGRVHERYTFTGNVWNVQDRFFDVRRTSVYRDNEWTPVHRRIRRVEEKKPEYFVDKIRNLFRR